MIPKHMCWVWVPFMLPTVKAQISLWVLGHPTTPKLMYTVWVPGIATLRNTIFALAQADQANFVKIV